MLMQSCGHRASTKYKKWLAEKVLTTFVCFPATPAGHPVSDAFQSGGVRFSAPPASHPIRPQTIIPDDTPTDHGKGNPKMWITSTAVSNS